MKSDARASRRPCARRLNAARGKTAAQNRTEARRQECRSCANPGNALRRRPTSGGWPKPDCHFRPVPRLPPNRGPLYASRLARQNRAPLIPRCPRSRTRLQTGLLFAFAVLLSSAPCFAPQSLAYQSLANLRILAQKRPPQCSLAPPRPGGLHAPSRFPAP